MGEESSIKLYGMWASPFVLRPKLALKIKGIEYEYIEEDLANKSELLLQYNPLYKQVPVFVHNGLPIVESFVIVEYIDETWTDPPHLLPKDPYLRAKHRFWVAYFEQVLLFLGKTLTEGKANEEQLNEYLKKLDVAEELLTKEMFLNGAPSFQDMKLGYLDIVFYSCFDMSDVLEDCFGIKLLTSERYPLLTSWLNALREVPEVKELTPPKPKMLQHLQVVLQKYLPPKQA
ncbi:hypothetical protein BVRB_5g114860 [Beta vulgaris subsp. vulgaris]|uniref:glutathione S-transferase U9 n=1 Tax=Beta vulgaris subsp. vulgaris TaxID=3555 RepID=UPI00053F8518|nr:glutathione S-transferase U9 [Beta vulgaris subsp. vulgaris]KMT10832.1 hypothetical protein BVRB_5g114860 [Beta vulgaris subsp. vulgaris]